MKTITVDVPDGVYERLEHAAQAASGTVAYQLVDVLRAWRPAEAAGSTSLRHRAAPFDSGGPVIPLTSEDDLLGEMLDESRN